MPRRREATAVTEKAIPSQDLEAAGAQSIGRRFAAFILLTGLAIVPVVVSPGADDLFRLPKELLLYAVTILSAATLLAGLLTGETRLDSEGKRRLRPFVLLAVAGMAWACVSAVLATNRALAFAALIWGGALVCLFLTAIVVMQTMSTEALAAAVFAPALANTIVLFLQASRLWNPWVFPENMYFRATKNALLGNPDDVGVYLSLPLLLAATLALRGRRWRTVWAVVAVLLAAGLLLSMTLTAIGASGIAGAVMLLRWDRRKGLAILAAATLAFCGAATLYTPMRDRAQSLIHFVLEEKWGRLVSGRLLPFVTTADLFRENPVTGVGPGCFKFEYMPRRVAIEDRWPELAQISKTKKVNFGEAHNDHLQLLAEVGLPGYLAVIAAFGLIAWPPRTRISRHEERSQIADTLALPLVVLVLVTMLAQFALQLAAPMAPAVLLGAACVAWRGRDAA